MTDDTQHVMTIWHVFKSPLDHPGKVVVRGFDIVRGKDDPVAQQTFYLTESVEEARVIISHLAPGSVCFERSPEDPQAVVETWL